MDAWCSLGFPILAEPDSVDISERNMKTPQTPITPPLDRHYPPAADMAPYKCVLSS